MKKIILVILSMTLFLSPAYAKKKSDSAPLTAGIQEVQAATLGDGENDKPKKKKKATKKAKKAKKAKKSSNEN